MLAVVLGWSRRCEVNLRRLSSASRESLKHEYFKYFLTFAFKKLRGKVAVYVTFLHQRLPWQQPPCWCSRRWSCESRGCHLCIWDQKCDSVNQRWRCERRGCQVSVVTLISQTQTMTKLSIIINNKLKRYYKKKYHSTPTSWRRLFWGKIQVGWKTFDAIKGPVLAAGKTLQALIDLLTIREEALTSTAKLTLARRFA